MKPLNPPKPRGWQGNDKDFEVTSKQHGHIAGRVGHLIQVEDCEPDEDEQERYGGQ